LHVESSSFATAGPTAVVISSTFTSSTAEAGGAIHQSYASTVTVTSTVFMSNHASSNLGANSTGGGAVTVYGYGNSSPMFEAKTTHFDSNSASNPGGAILIHGAANVSLIGVKFTSNTASSYSDIYATQSSTYSCSVGCLPNEECSGSCSGEVYAIANQASCGSYW